MPRALAMGFMLFSAVETSHFDNRSSFYVLYKEMTSYISILTLLTDNVTFTVNVCAALALVLLKLPYCIL